MRLYDETCVRLCEGQYLDIATSASDEPMTVELYFDMIGRKTAALISASIEAGALLATDDEAVIGGYRRFGWALGIAFQLNDDLLGIWGDGVGDGQGADGRRPAQEDAARPVRLRARRARRPRGASPSSTASDDPSDAERRGDRRRSSSGRRPATSPATRRAATATRRSASWTA